VPVERIVTGSIANQYLRNNARVEVLLITAQN
jgi:hypothetical protein